MRSLNEDSGGDYVQIPTDEPEIFRNEAATSSGAKAKALFKAAQSTTDSDPFLSSGQAGVSWSGRGSPVAATTSPELGFADPLNGCDDRSVTPASIKSVAEMQMEWRRRAGDIMDRSRGSSQASFWELGGHAMNSWPVQSIIALSIMANAVIIGLESDWPDLADWPMMEHILLALFAFELFLRVCFDGPRSFVDPRERDFAWNIFDTIVIGVGVADAVMHMMRHEHFATFASSYAHQSNIATLFRVLRLTRILRIFRGIRSFKQLYLLAFGVVEAFQAVLWVAVFMAAIMYVCAIILVRTMGSVANDDPYQQFLQHRFSTIPSSMLTLFQLMLAPDLETYDEVSRARPFFGCFLIAFIILGSFGALALMTGVVSQGMFDKNQIRIGEEKIERGTKRKLHKEECRAMYKLCCDPSITGAGQCTKPVLMDMLPVVAEMLDGFSASYSEQDLKGIVNIMPTDPNGVISLQDFCHGIMSIGEDGRSLENLVVDIYSAVSLVNGKVDDLSAHVLKDVRAKTTVTAKDERTKASIPEAAQVLHQDKFHMHMQQQTGFMERCEKALSHLGQSLHSGPASQHAALAPASNAAALPAVDQRRMEQEMQTMAKSLINQVEACLEVHRQGVFDACLEVQRKFLGKLEDGEVAADSPKQQDKGISQLQAECDALRSKVAAESQAKQLECAALQTQLREHSEARHQEHNALQAKHADALDSLRAELRAESNAYRLQVSELQEKLAEPTSSQKDRAAEGAKSPTKDPAAEAFWTRRLELEKACEGLQRELSEETKAKQRDCGVLQSQLREVTEQRSQDQAILHGKHSEVINSMQDKHSEALNTMHGKHSEALNSMQVRHSEAINSMQAQLRGEAEARRLEVDALQGKLSVLSIAAQQDRGASEAEKSARGELEKQCSVLRTKLVTQSTARQEEIREMTEAHSREQGTLQGKHAQAVSAVQAQLRAEAEARKLEVDGLQGKLRDVIDAHSREHGALQHKHAQAVDSVQAQLRAEAESRNLEVTSLRGKLAELSQSAQEHRGTAETEGAGRLALQEECDALRDKLANEVRGKQQECALLQSKLEEATELHSKEQGILQGRHAETLSSLRAELREATEGHSEGQRSLERKHAGTVDSMQAELQSKLREATEVYSQERRLLEGKHAEAVSSMQTELRKATEAHSQEQVLLQGKHAEAVSSMQAELRSHELQARNVSESHKVEVDTLQRQLDKLSQAGDAGRLELESERDALRDQLANESKAKQQECAALLAQLHEVRDSQSQERTQSRAQHAESYNIMQGELRAQADARRLEVEALQVKLTGLSEGAQKDCVPRAVQTELSSTMSAAELEECVSLPAALSGEPKPEPKKKSPSMLENLFMPPPGLRAAIFGEPDAAAAGSAAAPEKVKPHWAKLQAKHAQAVDSIKAEHQAEIEAHKAEIDSHGAELEALRAELAKAQDAANKQ